LTKVVQIRQLPVNHEIINLNPLSEKTPVIGNKFRTKGDAFP